MLLSSKLCFSENFMARKFCMGYFGGKILVQGFFEVLFEALEIFLGIDFRPPAPPPHSIIYRHLKSRVLFPRVP